MKLDDFIERDLVINEYGKIYDMELNEYRDENGEVDFLEVSDVEIFYIWRKQHEDIKANLLQGELK